MFLPSVLNNPVQTGNTNWPVWFSFCMVIIDYIRHAEWNFRNVRDALHSAGTIWVEITLVYFLIPPDI